MLEDIIIQNPWWKTQKLDRLKLGKIKRQDFETLKNELNDKKVSCIIGPRRAGKTTLIYELINYLLEKGTEAKNILYISFDNSKTRMEMKSGFNEIIRDFSSSIVREPVDKLSSYVYIFLDEAHKLEEWGDKVKYWQDLGLKIKFVVSGSSSVRILKGSGESLLGRIKFSMILPLKFSEFCSEGKIINFENFAELKKLHDDLLLKKDEILIKLEDYIIKGGFPEVCFENNIETVFNLLKQYKTLTISRDILDAKDIKEPRILSDFFDLLTDHMSERINYSTFSSLLKVKLDTIKKYLSYLEESFLIYSSYVYSKKRVLSTRKEKKLYFFDHGLRNSLLMKNIDELEKSKIIENIVFLHLFSLKKDELFPKIFYWLDESKNEVDFIINLRKRIIPIEVKYRNQISDKDLNGIIKFCKKNNVKTGIVVTKNLLERKKIDGKEMIFIPSWLFLLSV